MNVPVVLTSLKIEYPVFPVSLCIEASKHHYFREPPLDDRDTTYIYNFCKIDI